MIGKHSTKLGLGCVTFGREIDKKTSFSMMDYSFDQNILDFDTAAAYSNGLSEEFIGRWLAQNPSKKLKIKIATKIIPPFGFQQIINSVDQSLKRLQIDAIDLLYFHRWDEQLTDSSSWLASEELVSQGKVKKIGVSNFNSLQLKKAVDLLKVAMPLRINSIQNNHNLAVSDLSDELIHHCKDKEIEIRTFSPLGAGFLTGKHANGVVKESRFDLIPAHQQIYFNNEANERLEKLISVSTQTGHDPAFLALAWATHQQSVSEVLIGGRNVDQLKFAVEASSFYDEGILSILTEKNA